MSAAQPDHRLSVRQILNNCRRQIFLHTILVGWPTIATFVVGYTLCVGLLDYLLVLPSVVRAVVLGVFIVGIGVVVWRSLISPLLASLPAEQLGAAIDLSAPELKESLATLISIERPGVSDGEAGSSLMRRHLRQQLSKHLPNVTGRGVVDSHLTIRRCGIAGLVTMMGVLPFVMWPSGSICWCSVW